jgi:multisite-specific tRNA:(cytosine-C5)-methyltransferase
MDGKEALKVVACGLKMFERQSFGEKGTSCEYRIAQEGVPVILPYLTKQILYPSLDEFISLLRDRALPVPAEHIISLTDHRDAEKTTADNGDLDKPPPSKPQGCCVRDPKTLQELPNIRLGCCVALMREEDLSKLGLGKDSNETQGGLAANSPFAIPCWRGRASINVMVSKLDCAQMLERLETASPGITTPIID